MKKKNKITLIIALGICFGINAQWISHQNTNFYSMTHHENRLNDYGLNLQPSGGNPSYLIENNVTGSNRQLLFFGHGNGIKNIFGISTSTDSGLNWASRFSITQQGNIGIGTPNPDMKLTVKGNIHAEEVKIDLNVPAPDYVFKKDYNLKSLEEVEDFIKENSHLPEIPSAKEFEQDGVMQAEMDMNLLKKIEELTLYTIQQEKKINKLEKENESLKIINLKLLELQKRLEELEKK